MLYIEEISTVIHSCFNRSISYYKYKIYFRYFRTSIQIICNNNFMIRYVIKLLYYLKLKFYFKLSVHRYNKY